MTKDHHPEGSVFEARLRRLLRHEAFRSLRRRKERFCPFRALGIEGREHSHSNFLAFLLDPRKPHGLSDRFLRDFIARAADSQAITKTDSTPLPIKAELAVEITRVAVTRERYNIDILVDCHPDGPVIGIEVKVWAGEQEEQLQRYQDTLRSRYPGRPCLLVYLTPYGSEPKTCDQTHDVPCVLMRWGDISGLLEDLSRDEGTAGDAQPFIGAFSRHLREAFMGSKEDRDLAGQLFKDPEIAELFRTIEDIRPGLWDQDVQDALFERCDGIAKELTGGGIRHARDPESKKSEKAYLRIIPKELEEAFGLPICFVFYHQPGWRYQRKPAMHVLMYKGDGDDQSGHVKKDIADKWTHASDSSSVLAQGLAKLSDWDGYQVINDSLLSTDRVRTGWIFDDESFDEAWIDMAAGKFQEILELIHKELEQKLGSDA